MKALVIGRLEEKTFLVPDTEQVEVVDVVEVEELNEEGEVVTVEREVTRTVTNAIEREVVKVVPVTEEKVLSSEQAEALAGVRGVLQAVPSSVTMKQARKALITAGISIAKVDAAIAGIVDDQARELARTDWEYSQTVRRESSLVASIGGQLGLTNEQIDGLFIAAAGMVD